MKEILLTQDKVALIDDEEIARVFKNPWHARQSHNKKQWIVLRSADCMPLANFILDEPKGKIVDHANGDPFDNRKINLRVATKAENSRNRRMHSNNTSGYKGVSIKQGKWAARIGGKRIGSFSSPRQAAIAYDIQAIKLWGPFARTNGRMGLFRLTSKEE